MVAAAARERQFRAGCDEARLAECGARAREVAAQQLVQVRRGLFDARVDLGVWRGTPDAAWRTPARGWLHSGSSRCTTAQARFGSTRALTNVVYGLYVFYV